MVRMNPLKFIYLEDGWMLYGGSNGAYHHIIPEDDLIEHKQVADLTDIFLCSCDPGVIPDQNIIVHHPMDGRKPYSKGSKNE